MVRYHPPHTPNGFYQGSGRPDLPAPLSWMSPGRLSESPSMGPDSVEATLQSGKDDTEGVEPTVPLRELRRQRRVSQQGMAHKLSIQQAAVSKLERREDMHLSTLRKYVQALGGRLEIIAHFPADASPSADGEGVRLSVRGTGAPQANGDRSRSETIVSAGLAH